MNSVAENATNGTTVGITASASDADATNNLITYSLDDDAGGRFTINSSTGVVTVANGSLLNYEAATNHTIIVRATSQDASFSTQSYIINLTDVNEGSVGPISDANASANTVLENSAIGTTVGITAQASDPDGTDSVTYSLDDNAGGRFTINSTTGVVTVAGSLDRETAATYNITVRATSTDSSSTTQVYTISLGDVDEFDVGSVSDTNATTNAVNENAAIGTTVGITASASDADATTNGITYSLVNDDGGRFAINSSTGVVTVAGAINRESDGPTRNIIVRATSADGSFTDQAYTIAINDVDEFDVGSVSDTDATTNAVNENAAIGTTVGITASASDADATTNGITYSLVSDDSGRFAINSTTGVVTVAGAINRETDGPTRNITVRATSADGSFTDQAYTITINDVDEFDVGSVSDTDATTNAVNENAAIGTTVGITASLLMLTQRPMVLPTRSINDDSGRFAINSTTGVVTVAGAINREADGPTRNITVRATSADGSFTDQAYTITINDVDEFDVGSVSDTDAITNAVNENAAIGTTVGITASASDADATTNGITYSLVSDDSGRFAINSTTGVVTVAGTLDREAIGSTRAITVRATSSDGSFTDQIFSIAILDVDEFDVSVTTDADPTSNSITENAAIGSLVGITAAAQDADATNSSVSFSLVNDDGGRFVIDSQTGIVSLAGTIDREVDGAARTIVVRSTSADGSFSDQSFTINVVDVDEFDVGPINDTNALANSVAENAATGTTVGLTANASDADATQSSVTYALIDDAGGRFAIDANSGVVTVANGSLLDFEVTTSHSIIVRATSADGSFSNRTYTIAVTDVNESAVSAISDANAAINSVQENAAIGTTVGITAQAIDPDGTDSVTYSLDANAGGLFAIDANTGVVTVAGSIDREQYASLSIVVRATSSDASFSLRTFTIDITDLDEYDASPISNLNTGSVAVAENSPAGTSVGIVAFSVDQDATQNIITYSLVNDAAGRFAIDSVTGSVTVASNADLNYESQRSHEIVVRALSSDGSFTDRTFTIQVVNVNEAPSVRDLAFTTNNVQALSVPASSIQSGLQDPEGDALTVAVAHGPQNGSVVMLADGSFVYTPNAGFVGTDWFTYTANDGSLDSDTRTITIDVTMPPSVATQLTTIPTTAIATHPPARTPLARRTRRLQTRPRQVQTGLPIQRSHLRLQLLQAMRRRPRRPAQRMLKQATIARVVLIQIPW